MSAVLTRARGNPRGAAAARNLGIAKRAVELVAFFDADDLYEPIAGSLARSLQEHPEVAMVYGPTRWWHPGAEHGLDRGPARPDECIVRPACSTACCAAAARAVHVRVMIHRAALDGRWVRGASASTRTRRCGRSCCCASRCTSPTSPAPATASTRLGDRCL